MRRLVPLALPDMTTTWMPTVDSRACIARVAISGRSAADVGLVVLRLGHGAPRRATKLTPTAGFSLFSSPGSPLIPSAAPGAARIRATSPRQDGIGQVEARASCFCRP